MKHYGWGLLCLSLLLILTFGCSSNQSKTPVTPAGDNTPYTFDAEEGHSVLASGTFEIDPVNMVINDVTDRIGSVHYNITGFLGGNFKYFIQSVNGPIWTLRLEITNPTSLQVHDVRIIYTDFYGKTVLNPDGYTNLWDPPTGPDWNPFHYFAKEYPNQAFPVGPGGVDDEILELYWPAGAGPHVTYIIECSIGGNALEPWKITSIQQIGSLTPDGGGKIITAQVNDWQNDVSAVSILANDFHSVDVPMYQYLNTNVYVGNLVNLNGVVPGDYQVWIKAESPNPASVSLWMPFTVTVADTSNEAPKFDYLPFAAPDNVSKGMSTYLNGAAQDQENSLNYYWEQISPSSPTGDFSGTLGQNSASVIWRPPQVAQNTQHLLTVRVGEVGGSNISRAVVAVQNMTPLAPEITNGPVVVPDPVNEGTYAQFGVTAMDPNQPDQDVVFKYQWEQMSPTSPVGEWVGTVGGVGRYPVWIAPQVTQDTVFTFKVSVSKDWIAPPLSTEGTVDFTVKNTN